jgi:hypothetical protein
MALRAGLRVKHGLRQSQPLGLVRRRVREAELGGQHGRHAPEALVVVSQGEGHVGRHVVAVGAGLVHHGLGNDGVVRVVARVLPVVDQRPPHGSGLPPVVVPRGRGAGEDAGSLARLVAVVVLHQVPGDGGGSLFDVG